MIVAKTLAARKRIRDRGERCEGRKPFGTRPGEPEMLAKMKALRDAGATFEQIAESLNRSGSLTRYGKPWLGATIAKILSRV